MAIDTSRHEKVVVLANQFLGNNLLPANNKRTPYHEQVGVNEEGDNKRGYDYKGRRYHRAELAIEIGISLSKLCYYMKKLGTEKGIAEVERLKRRGSDGIQD